ncbi:MAG: hypothetical protein K2X63_07610, partial [Burkholderiaceae bacterium]|nr:hypothetical protein [Burkholderiaceae bacterium]
KGTVSLRYTFAEVELMGVFMKRALGALVLAFTIPAGHAAAAQSCAQSMQQIKDAAKEIRDVANKSKEPWAVLIVGTIVDVAVKADDKKISEFCGRPDNAQVLKFVQPYLEAAKEAVKGSVVLVP